jgi:hypothetical protein
MARNPLASLRHNFREGTEDTDRLIDSSGVQRAWRTKRRSTQRNYVAQSRKPPSARLQNRLICKILRFRAITRVCSKLPGQDSNLEKQDQNLL